MLLKLLSDPRLSLIKSQANTTAILLHLLESTLLVLGIGGRESSLGMLVDLFVVVVGRQRERVESIVDTSSADGGRLVVVQLSKVETTRLFDGGLALLGGFGGSVGFILCQEGILFGLLPGSLCLLVGFSFSAEWVSFNTSTVVRVAQCAHFFALLLAPFCHLSSSAASFRESSAAAF